MIVHILNGDGLAENFNLAGEVVICRECLIEGNLTADKKSDFWQVRADFINNSYYPNSYIKNVKVEFDKLNQIIPTDEVNLWFGNEAFCQVNMWFCLSLLAEKDVNIYRVLTDANGWHCGFNDLEKCFQRRCKLSKNEIALGKDLWKAFCLQDFETLQGLSKTNSENFPGLEKVCLALMEKDSKPKQILHEIMGQGETDFTKIFTQFQAKAKIYGFGDLQVKRILKTMNSF
jgi:hypothetical protein